MKEKYRTGLYFSVENRQQKKKKIKKTESENWQLSTALFSFPKIKEKLEKRKKKKKEGNFFFILNKRNHPRIKGRNTRVGGNSERYRRVIHLLGND